MANPLGRPVGILSKLSEPELQRAIDMYLDGASLRTAARAVGVSYQNLSGRLRSRGIPRRTRPTWKGSANPKFNDGGHYVNRDGYVIAYDAGKKRKRHRIVVEREIGRMLEDHETVHHDDENKAHNSDGNLKIMSHAEHSRMHAIERWSNPEWKAKEIARRRAAGNPGAFKPGQNRR
jgi:hypothetical protein